MTGRGGRTGFVDRRQRPASDHFATINQSINQSIKVSTLTKIISVALFLYLSLGLVPFVDRRQRPASDLPAKINQCNHPNPLAQTTEKYNGQRSRRLTSRKQTHTRVIPHASTHTCAYTHIHTSTHTYTSTHTSIIIIIIFSFNIQSDTPQN